MKTDLYRKIVIGAFLSVPLISSIISTVHLIDLFSLGNISWLAIMLAVVFEIGSIASFLAMSVLDKIKVGGVWFIFLTLAILQIIGNVYYSYSYVSDQLLSNSTFLNNFTELFDFIIDGDIKTAKLFLSCIIGIPIPLIALIFLKSNVDYIRPNNNIEINEAIENIELENIQSKIDETQIIDELNNKQLNNEQLINQDLNINNLDNDLKLDENIDLHITSDDSDEFIKKELEEFYNKIEDSKNDISIDNENLNLNTESKEYEEQIESQNIEKPIINKNNKKLEGKNNFYGGMTSEIR